MSKHRNYCFTSFQGKIDFNKVKNVKYAIQGTEVCPDTGKEHEQGFVIFKNPRGLAGVIKEFTPIHFEVCQGNVKSNIEYCSKDGNFTEYGDRPTGQGHRSDLDSAIALVREGGSDREVADNEPSTFVRFNRGLREYRRIMFEEKRNWEMDVRIYWGEPGTGKTRSVYDEFGVENVYEKMAGRWWDGYNYEKVTLIDDFDPSDMYDIVYSFYLKLLDRYPLRVEVKGGTVQFCSKVIVFTSNFNPDGWFAERVNRDAFFRRISEIRLFPVLEQGT